MRYLPLTTEERKTILDTCGVKNFEELIGQVPDSLRVKGLLDLEEELCESELLKHLGELASKNAAAKMTSFLGQGVYDHSWPKVIDQITNRGEFLTAYTPYQPEISQGTLQAIFEYQSMIADLTGMEVSNASLYDGATSVVEGILMAARLQNLKQGRILISEGTFSRYQDVIRSYLEPLGFTLEVWKANPKSFRCEASTLGNSNSTTPIAAVVMQSPNQWGLVEDWNELSQTAQVCKSKSIAVVTHALSLSIFSPPGEHAVDIVAGEAQALGVPVGFGGPHLGLICCRKSDVRQMPGRLIGATEDSRGQRAFCITLATREQHIRREKATSNICSNQNYMLLRACMFMSLMGPGGLKRMANLSRNRAWQARILLGQALSKSPNPEIKVLEGEIFNEICVLVPSKKVIWIDEVRAAAERLGMLAGTPVPVPASSGFVSGLSLAFTESHTTEDVQKLVGVLANTSSQRS